MNTTQTPTSPQQTTESTRTATTDADSRPEEPPDDGGQLPLDVVFDVLSNERRRRVLRYLQETPETTLGDLAEHVASIENGKPEHALTSTERKRVYIVLYQCHLPRMDDAEVIDFDQHRKTVEFAENAEQVTQYLPPDDAPAKTGHESGWSAGLGAVSRLLARLG